MNPLDPPPTFAELLAIYSRVVVLGCGAEDDERSER